jgi:hypothetical protein
MNLSNGKTLIWFAIIGLLTLSLFFGLGYLSGYSFHRNPIIIEKCGE